MGVGSREDWGSELDVGFVVGFTVMEGLEIGVGLDDFVGSLLGVEMLSVVDLVLVSCRVFLGI